jgi:hypothetical protein
MAVPRSQAVPMVRIILLPRYYCCVIGPSQSHVKYFVDAHFPFEHLWHGYHYTHNACLLHFCNDNQDLTLLVGASANAARVAQELKESLKERGVKPGIEFTKVCLSLTLSRHDQKFSLSFEFE